MPPRPKPKAKVRGNSSSIDPIPTFSNPNTATSNQPSTSHLKPIPNYKATSPSGDSDNDEFESNFFNRRSQFTRNTSSKATTQSTAIKSESKSKPKLDLGPPSPGSIIVLTDDSDEEEVEDSSSSGSVSEEEEGGKKRKRKRSRVKVVKDLLPAWTRDPTLTQDPESSNTRSSREPSAKIGGNGRAKSDGIIVIDSSDEENDTNIREEREPSFTPPPPVEQYVLLNARNFLKTTLASRGATSRLQDEEVLNQQSTEEIIKLNPDLALLYKGPEASRVRELALAEQKQRAEKKRVEKERRRAELREKELENQRSGNKASDRDQDMDSDDAFEVQPVTDSKGKQAAISLGSSSNSPGSDRQGSPSRTASTSAAPQGEAEEDEEEAAAPADDGPRISLTLKAKGNISWNVRARPTTIISKLLNGFLDSQKDQIKLNRTQMNKCRIEFDGDKLMPNSTVEDNDLEDDFQLEVVW